MRWTLCNHETGQYEPQVTITARDLDGSSNERPRVTKRTLRGGLSDGVDVIDVDNGAARFILVPTRGMGIARAWFGDSQPLGWKSPISGPVHPQFVPLAEAGGLGWLDGFDEFLCRCGLESNGSPEYADGKLKYPLHGRIANRPAHRVQVDFDRQTNELVIEGEVEESRFLFQKLRLVTTVRTRLGEHGFRIRDEVTNLRGVPSSMQLLYHINFGPPLLGAGAQLLAPIAELVPRNAHAAADLATWNQYTAPQAGFSEQVYFARLAADAESQTRVVLRNARGDRAASLRFRTDQLPCFTMWKNTAATADGYVTGLEPGTNYPNGRSFEEANRRVVPLAPGEARVFELACELHGNAEEAAAAQRHVAELQATCQRVVHATPQPTWCAP
jgi:galactose mutarotase-like enzyme